MNDEIDYYVLTSSVTWLALICNSCNSVFGGSGAGAGAGILEKS